MHDADAEGNEFFKCDFCRASWSEDRPMVEGHKGSLICASCLTLAHAEVVARDGGEPFGEHDACTLCLMHREGMTLWRSPAEDRAAACRECVVRAGVMLAKDPDYDWSPPTG